MASGARSKFGAPMFEPEDFGNKCTVLKKVHGTLLGYIHGPCRRFCGDQNDEDTRTFCGKFLYNAIASTDNAQYKNCPSSGIDDRPGRDLFRMLKRSPISQPHTLGLRRGFRWEGSRQHDRTPTKIASALENFPATVIMPSPWPD